MGLNKFVTKVLVLSLPSRKDRRKAISERLNRLGVAFQFVDAIPGSDLEPYGGKHAGRNASGCYCTHLLAVSMANVAKWKSVCILEDDVVFHKDFNNHLNRLFKDVPADWEMITMGCIHIDQPEPVNDYIVKNKKSVGTWAYILRQSVYEDFIKVRAGASNKNDVYTSMLMKDHAVYSPAKGIVGVAKDWSDIKQMNYDPENFNFSYRDNVDYKEMDL